MRHARHVHRDLPRPSEDDGTGCGIMILLVLFFLMMWSLSWMDSAEDVNKANAEMVRRCVKDAQPPDYCVELAKRMKP